MQNAGCGHLHHAHCLRMGNDNATVANCPSGCPLSTFPREAAIFGPPTPRIIVAWDGDKIDYVPIPAPQDGFSQTGPLRLSSDEVVSLIRNFLSSKGFAVPGLFLRIHKRDPITEYALPSGCAWKLMCFFGSYQNRAVHPIDSRLRLSSLNTHPPNASSFPNLPKSACNFVTFVA